MHAGTDRLARRIPRITWIAAWLASAAVAPAHAQGFLEQFSYEGIRLAGISVEFGGVVSDRLAAEPTGAIRVDLGYLAPGVRVMIGGSYFKGTFTSSQITAFEQRLLDVIDDPTNDATVNVGTVTWMNAHVDADLQYVFRPNGMVRPYVGLGMSLIVRDGDGPAITGTFVEDALDTFTAGLAASVGVEFQLARWLAMVIDGRGSLTSELRSLAGRGGFKILIPGGR